jgi:hypothetical protein
MNNIESKSSLDPIQNPLSTGCSAHESASFSHTKTRKAWLKSERAKKTTDTSPIHTPLSLSARQFQRKEGLFILTSAASEIQKKEQLQRKKKEEEETKERNLLRKQFLYQTRASQENPAAKEEIEKTSSFCCAMM